MNEEASELREVAQVATTVEDIAYRTNLLALDLAIEAARSGTQGKRIAVLAGDLRKLAEQSQAAAERIGVLVTTLRRPAAG
jgi:methyl-accepting chemotaxis protein